VLDIRHWLIMPWPKVQPKIVPATAGFEHQVAETGLPMSQLVCDNPRALDTAAGMLDANPKTRNEAIAHFVCVGQLTSAGLLSRLQNGPPCPSKALQASLLGSYTALGNTGARCISQSFVVLFALNRLAAETDVARFIHDHSSLAGVCLLLAAVGAVLLFWGLRTIAGAFGTIMKEEPRCVLSKGRGFPLSGGKFATVGKRGVAAW
jgi:hypothetical protein